VCWPKTTRTAWKVRKISGCYCCCCHCVTGCMHMCVFVQSKRVNSFNHFDCVISLWLLNVKKNLEAAILTSEHTAFLATLSATTKEGSSVFFSYFSVYSLDSRDPRLFQVDLKRVCPAHGKNWEIYLHIRFFTSL